MSEEVRDFVFEINTLITFNTTTLDNTTFNTSQMFLIKNDGAYREVTIFIASKICITNAWQKIVIIAIF